MTSERAGSPDPGGPRPNDAEIRAIAEQLVREHGQPPPASPGNQRSTPEHALAPADEERVEDAFVAPGSFDVANTTRADEAPGGPARRGEADAFDAYERLADAVAADRVQFLETELQVGNTMLNAANSTRDAEARVRRVARAQEAHDEVARHLATDAPSAFSTAERGELMMRLTLLRARLADAA